MDDNGTIRLADFGTVRLREEQGHDGARRMQGSPLYMAPETIAGKAPSSASDVWGVGCTVLEMLSGMVPWRSKGFADAQALFTHVLRNETATPPVPAGLSANAVDFLSRCFARDPLRRPGCRELLTHPFVAAVARSLPAAAPASRMESILPDVGAASPGDVSGTERRDGNRARTSTRPGRAETLASAMNANSMASVKLQRAASLTSDAHRPRVLGSAEHIGRRARASAAATGGSDTSRFASMAETPDTSAGNATVLAALMTRAGSSVMGCGIPARAVENQSAQFSRFSSGDGSLALSSVLGRVDHRQARGTSGPASAATAPIAEPGPALSTQQTWMGSGGAVLSVVNAAAGSEQQKEFLAFDSKLQTLAYPNGTDSEGSQLSRQAGAAASTTRRKGADRSSGKGRVGTSHGLSTVAAWQGVTRAASDCVFAPAAPLTLAAEAKSRFASPDQPGSCVAAAAGQSQGNPPSWNSGRDATSASGAADGEGTLAVSHVGRLSFGASLFCSQESASCLGSDDNTSVSDQHADGTTRVVSTPPSAAMHPSVPSLASGVIQSRPSTTGGDSIAATGAITPLSLAQKPAPQLSVLSLAASEAAHQLAHRPADATRPLKIEQGKTDTGTHDQGGDVAGIPGAASTTASSRATSGTASRPATPPMAPCCSDGEHQQSAMRGGHVAVHSQQTAIMLANGHGCTRNGSGTLDRCASGDSHRAPGVAVYANLAVLQGLRGDVFTSQHPAATASRGAASSVFSGQEAAVETVLQQDIMSLAATSAPRWQSLLCDSEEQAEAAPCDVTDTPVQDAPDRMAITPHVSAVAQSAVPQAPIKWEDLLGGDSDAVNSSCHTGFGYAAGLATLEALSISANMPRPALVIIPEPGDVLAVLAAPPPSHTSGGHDKMASFGFPAASQSSGQSNLTGLHAKAAISTTASDTLATGGRNSGSLDAPPLNPVASGDAFVDMNILPRSAPSGGALSASVVAKADSSDAIHPAFRSTTRSFRTRAATIDDSTGDLPLVGGRIDLTIGSEATARAAVRALDSAEMELPIEAALRAARHVRRGAGMSQTREGTLDESGGVSDDRRGSGDAMELAELLQTRALEEWGRAADAGMLDLTDPEKLFGPGAMSDEMGGTPAGETNALAEVEWVEEQSDGGVWMPDDDGNTTMPVPGPGPPGADPTPPRHSSGIISGVSAIGHTSSINSTGSAHAAHETATIAGSCSRITHVSENCRQNPLSLALPASSPDNIRPSWESAVDRDGLAGVHLVIQELRSTAHSSSPRSSDRSGSGSAHDDARGTAFIGLGTVAAQHSPRTAGYCGAGAGTSNIVSTLRRGDTVVSGPVVGTAEPGGDALTTSGFIDLDELEDDCSTQLQPVSERADHVLDSIPASATTAAQYGHQKHSPKPGFGPLGGTSRVAARSGSLSTPLVAALPVVDIPAGQLSSAAHGGRSSARVEMAGRESDRIASFRAASGTLLAIAHSVSFGAEPRRSGPGQDCPSSGRRYAPVCKQQAAPGTDWLDERRPRSTAARSSSGGCHQDRHHGDTDVFNVDMQNPESGTSSLALSSSVGTDLAGGVIASESCASSEHGGGVDSSAAEGIGSPGLDRATGDTVTRIAVAHAKHPTSTAASDSERATVIRFPLPDSNVVMCLGPHGVGLSSVPEDPDYVANLCKSDRSSRTTSAPGQDSPTSGSRSMDTQATARGLSGPPDSVHGDAVAICGDQVVTGLGHVSAGEADAALRGFMGARARNATAASFGQSWTDDGHVVIYSNSGLLRRFVQSGEVAACVDG